MFHINANNTVSILFGVQQVVGVVFHAAFVAVAVGWLDFAVAHFAVERTDRDAQDASCTIAAHLLTLLQTKNCLKSVGKFTILRLIPIAWIGSYQLFNSS